MKTRVMMIGGIAITACTLLAAGAPDGTRWWSYIEFLASDKLEGRNTGSEGHRKAAEFVAAQFERDGLKPAPGERLENRFQLRQAAPFGVADRGLQPFVDGHDFLWWSA